MGRLGHEQTWNEKMVARDRESAACSTHQHDVQVAGIELGRGFNLQRHISAVD